MSEKTDALKEKAKEELGEAWEDTKDEAGEWVGDVKNFWNIDPKALIITVVIAVAVGVLIGAILL